MASKIYGVPDRSVGFPRAPAAKGPAPKKPAASKPSGKALPRGSAKAAAASMKGR